jgi:hypothetical protein
MSRGIITMRVVGNSFKNAIQNEYQTDTKKEGGSRNAALKKYRAAVHEFALWRKDLEDNMHSFPLVGSVPLEILCGKMEGLSEAGESFKHVPQAIYRRNTRDGVKNAYDIYKNAVDEFAIWARNFEMILLSFPDGDGRGGVSPSQCPKTLKRGATDGGRGLVKSKGGNGYE